MDNVDPDLVNLLDTQADQSDAGIIRCRFIFSGKNDELTPDFLLELQNKNVATVAQVWPSANSSRIWARKRTLGSGSLRYRSSNAWRCRASRITLRVMGASTRRGN